MRGGGKLLFGPQLTADSAPPRAGKGPGWGRCRSTWNW